MVEKKTAILIPGTAGSFRILYLISSIIARKIGAIVTVKLPKIELLLKKKRLNKVIILTGSKDKVILNAYETYKRLRALNKDIKLVLIDSNTWPVKTILIPGEENTVKTILDAAF